MDRYPRAYIVDVFMHMCVGTEDFAIFDEKSKVQISTSVYVHVYGGNDIQPS